jgi:hypothetical protein
MELPGSKGKFSELPRPSGYRAPRKIVNLCGARPIDLAIIDGITSMEGGEGPWCEDAKTVRMTKPGVIIAGLNAVSTDAVGTAVMDYANPRARRGTDPFLSIDNHLLLAERPDSGTAVLRQIEVLDSRSAVPSANTG